MSKSFRFAAATALLGLGLAVSAGARAGIPVYTYAAAGNVDNPDTLVEDMAFFGGSALALADFSSAATSLGVNHAAASGNGSGGYFGAVSVWSDLFTATGASGAGSANVSVTINGSVGAAPFAMGGYALLKSDEVLTPEQLYSFLGSGLPAGVDVVMWGTGDSVSNPGALHVVMTGTVAFDYDTPFYLTSVFGVAATGLGSADFSNTAQFGISLNGPGTLTPLSGTAYVAAVPEAHEWALMLAGLGLIGLQARRRRDGQRLVA